MRPLSSPWHISESRPVCWDSDSDGLSESDGSDPGHARRALRRDSDPIVTRTRIWVKQRLDFESDSLLGQESSESRTGSAELAPLPGPATLIFNGNDRLRRHAPGPSECAARATRTAVRFRTLLPMPLQEERAAGE